MATAPSKLSISQKNIVVLGASYSGISMAHSLLDNCINKLGDPSSYRVILVSPSAHVMCRQACPRAMISDDIFDQSKLFVSITERFKTYPGEDFRFIQGAATLVDVGARTVTITKHSDSFESEITSESTTESVTFHSLIVATGASTPSPLFGFNNGGKESLRASWEAFRKALPVAKKIVIAGGGPAGIETAGELGDHLNGRAGMFSRRKNSVEIVVICGGQQILPALRPGLANKAEAMLRKLGVTVLKSTRVVRVEPARAGEELDKLDSKTKIYLDDGTEVEADLYIPATGYRPNTSFLPEELLGADRKVMANSQTLRIPDMPRLYAIGDCTSAFRPAVHNIAAAIPVLATNVLRDLMLEEGATNGIPEERVFKEDTREGQLVPIGKRGGVGAVMGWALPSWLVWLIKGRDYWLWTMPLMLSAKT